MSPAFDESSGSPCRSCPYRFEDKKKFIECINCEKRFGGNTRFLPERAKKGGGNQRMPLINDCKWPHGCSSKTAKSDYCTDHQKLIQDRKRRYKKQGMTEEEMEPFVFAPEWKGIRNDPLGNRRKDGTL